VPDDRQTNRQTAVVLEQPETGGEELLAEGKADAYAMVGADAERVKAQVDERKTHGRLEVLLVLQLGTQTLAETLHYINYVLHEPEECDRQVEQLLPLNHCARGTGLLRFVPVLILSAERLGNSADQLVTDRLI